MSRALFLSVVLIFCNFAASAQEFIRLWPESKMPNSKGMALTDSIYDERYRRVGTPGMLAFFPFEAGK